MAEPKNLEEMAAFVFRKAHPAVRVEANGADVRLGGFPPDCFGYVGGQRTWAIEHTKAEPWRGYIRFMKKFTPFSWQFRDYATRVLPECRADLEFDVTSGINGRAFDPQRALPEALLFLVKHHESASEVTRIEGIDVRLTQRPRTTPFATTTLLMSPPDREEVVRERLEKKERRLRAYREHGLSTALIIETGISEQADNAFAVSRALANLKSGKLIPSATEIFVLDTACGLDDTSVMSADLWLADRVRHAPDESP